ncbi:apolipoprotein N-acyltransferase [Solicola sp. PLA-1-18]|uniref:apolipoprotein N-acyltransferase n=1 Tax=Solicola sp. PLA-1-18 TaxID=3380532 RepID=UPI003B7A26EC
MTTLAERADSVATSLTRLARAGRRASWAGVLVGAGSAGALCAAAFAPLQVPAAPVLGTTALLVVLRTATVREATIAAATGVAALFAATFLVPTLWWMRVVSDGAFVGLVVAQILLVSVSVLTVRLVLVLRWWPVWVPAAWVLSEWVRGSIPFGGFPWARLGYSALDTPLESYVRIVGVPAMSALVVALASALTFALGHRTRTAVVASAAAVLATVSLGAVLPTGPAGATGSKQIAVVQGDVPVLFEPWPRGRVLEMHLEATRRLARAVAAGTQPAPDLVLWPENSLDTDPLVSGVTGSRLSAAATEVGAPILVGAILDGPTDATARNAGIAWTPDGPGGIYLKQNLVPFGEYVPFRQALGNIVPRFDRDVPRDMVPGTTSNVVDLGGVSVGDMLCWDVAHDDVVRDLISAGAQLLVVQTSNASFTGTAQPAQQWQISRLRAIEAGRDVAVPSTNGISGVIDAHGDVIARAPTQRPAYLSLSVTLAEGVTPAVRWGGLIQGLLVAAGAAGVALTPLTRRSERRRQTASGNIYG